MYLFSTPTFLLSLLPALIAAEQAPLKDKAAGWFDKAKAYIPSSVPSVPNPVDASASILAAHKVEKINIRNWERKLTPKLEGEQEWMVYLTGGNKSCFGRCGKSDFAFNESIPLLTAASQGPGAPSLKIGLLDCEKDAVLCTAWAAAVPSVFHFVFPQRKAGPSTVQSETPLHVVNLNTTTINVEDFTSIPRTTKSRYLHFDKYDGILHPIDGFLVKYKLLIPLGWVLWGFGTTPSWLMMIGISFVSRQIMSRRMVNNNRPDIYGNRPPAPAAPAAPARPPPAAAAGGANAIRSGGKKKR